jgi:hypothetical protein
MPVVYRSSDPGRFALAKSLLEAEGITFFERGEALQDLFGYGRIGGRNLVVGPAELAVPEDRAGRALEVLAELLEAERAIHGADS